MRRSSSKIQRFYSSRSYLTRTNMTNIKMRKATLRAHRDIHIILLFSARLHRYFPVLFSVFSRSLSRARAPFTRHTHNNTWLQLLCCMSYALYCSLNGTIKQSPLWAHLQSLTSGELISSVPAFCWEPSSIHATVGRQELGQLWRLCYS